MHFVKICMINCKTRPRASFGGYNLITRQFFNTPSFDWFPKRVMNERNNTTMSNEQGAGTLALGNKSTVLIYSGEGSSEDSRKLLYDALIAAVDSRFHRVEYITPEEIKEGSWTRNCCVIGFGGGYDLGFIRALGREGTDIIRRFVQQGGSYLGFCAGAYWACDYIEFDKGGPLQVVGERHLKFYPGNCIGPAFPGFEYKNKKGTHAVPVTYRGLMFRSYLHGGGFFTQPLLPLDVSTPVCDAGPNSSAHLGQNEVKLNTFSKTDLTYNNSQREEIAQGPPASQANRILASNISSSPSGIHQEVEPHRKEESTRVPQDYCARRNYEVLGTFTSLSENPGAFVKCSVGRGKAILSGVHIEFPVALLDQDNSNLKPLLPALRESEEMRNVVFKDILQQVHIRLKPQKSLL